MSLRISISGGFATAAVLIALSLAAAQDAPNLTPQSGVLLLKNGQMLKGEITRAGDHFVVTLGVGGEVKLAADKVETQCADLMAVYDWKLRRLSGEGAGPHLDLAEWCLKQQMFRQCAQQLSLALAADAKNPRIDVIDRRLQLAMQEPPPATAAPPISTTVNSEELDKMLRDLPKGSLERFTTIVQPMLNNRCATSHCHGATSTSQFRLLRPPSGMSAPQRFTQRNLFAALQFVDRDDPANSKLLTVPQEPHGGGKDAAFDARSKSQVADLQKWIELLAPPKEAPVPVTIAAQATQHSTPSRTLSQSATDQIPSGAPHPGHSVPRGSHPHAPTPPQPTAPAPKKIPPWRPRDPFDPEIFNRQQAGNK